MHRWIKEVVERLYKNIFVNESRYDIYSFDEDKAYDYFVYVVSLIHGGEKKFYDNQIINYRGVKSVEGSYFYEMTPIEKLFIHTKLRGILSGDYDFKYRGDGNLNSFSLVDYKKAEFLRYLDNKIEQDIQNIIELKKKMNTKKI